MLKKLTNGKIVMGICLPKSLKETIDHKRGDIPRSKYISRILEKQLVHENEIVNQQNMSRPLSGQGSADSYLSPEAFDNIRHPYKSIESRLLDIAQQIKDVRAEINKKMDNPVNRVSNSQVGGS